MIDPRVVEEFLAQDRIAVVGVSDDERSFARTVYLALRDHGAHPVPVHRTATTVAGDVAHPDLASVPGPIDGALVMVPRDRAAMVVREALDIGVPRIWLFKGAGPGAVSDEAIELCRAAGVPVVEGACPLMFLEPVGWFHRVHRRLRQVNGSLAKAS